MKTLMIIAIVGLGSILVGCDNPSTGNVSDKDNMWISHGRFAATKVVEIEDHTYIILDSYKGGGIIHAESCRCKKQ